MSEREEALNLFAKVVMGDARVLQGWLGGHYDDLSLHSTKEEADRGMFNAGYTLDELTRDFQGKKVRITIEVVE